ncbi:MAG: hypothetical protein PHO65_07205 [Sulfurovum sp.]|nr:hypothetical protein [Sulfurovum sp.]
MKKYIIISFVLGVFFSVCYATNDGNASIAPKEYDKMFKYIEKYNPKEKDIVQTIYSKDGEIYDCIDFYKQSSLKEVDKKTLKFPKPPKSVTKALIDRSDISAENTQLSDLLFPVTCPNGTVGIRRMTMDELTKFKTLDDYIASFNLKKNYQKKVSSESDTNTIPEPALEIDETKRLHSIVTFFKTNIGTASNINIWKHNGMDPNTIHLSISQV